MFLVYVYTLLQQEEGVTKCVVYGILRHPPFAKIVLSHKLL